MFRCILGLVSFTVGKSSALSFLGAVTLPQPSANIAVRDSWCFQFWSSTLSALHFFFFGRLCFIVSSTLFYK
jgi:hypothetical protein